MINLKEFLIERGIDCQVDLSLNDLSQNYKSPTRFSTHPGRPSDDAGWAVLFVNDDGSKVVKAGDYREGIEEAFQVTKGALSAAKKETEETRIKNAAPLNTVSTQSPAFRYLANRGLKESVIRELSEDIRILDNVTYWVVDGNKNYKPLMSSTIIASLIKSKETGEMVAWHKIHMDKDGNKPQILLDEGKTTKKVKKVSNNIDMKNSAILIAEAIPGTDWSDAEAVAEGVESAIALRQLGFTGRIYSLSSTAGFKTLVMEPGKKIYMAYEGDPASKKALHDFYINNTDSEVFVFSFGDKTDANDAVLSGVDSLPEAAPYMAFKQGEFKPLSDEELGALEERDDEESLMFPHVQFNSNGEVSKVSATIENVEVLLRRMSVEIRSNEMSRQIEIDFKNLSQKEKDELGYLADGHLDTMITDILDQAELNRMPLQRIPEMVTRIAKKNRYHPVVEWIESKEWDGQSRFKELMATIKVPAEQEELKHVFFRRWMIAAVGALYQPKGIGAEGTIVFSGKHGKGKSRWVRSLLPTELQMDAFKEGATLDPKDKDSVNQVVTKWIVELGEIDATFRKADIAELKAFLTKSVDEYRMPYARFDSKFSRRTVFFGTVNEKEFLQDQTGNRRFWSLSPLEIIHEHEIDMQQLWAEVKTWYESGEQWWLTDGERQMLGENDKNYRVAMAVEEIFNETFYDEIGQIRLQVSADKMDISQGFLDMSKGLTVPDCLKAMGLRPDDRMKQRELSAYFSHVLDLESKRTSRGRRWFLRSSLPGFEDKAITFVQTEGFNPAGKTISFTEEREKRGGESRPPNKSGGVISNTVPQEAPVPEAFTPPVNHKEHIYDDLFEIDPDMLDLIGVDKADDDGGD